MSEKTLFGMPPIDKVVSWLSGITMDNFLLHARDMVEFVNTTSQAGASTFTAGLPSAYSSLASTPRAFNVLSHAAMHAGLSNRIVVAVCVAMSVESHSAHLPRRAELLSNFSTHFWIPLLHSTEDILAICDLASDLAPDCPMSLLSFIATSGISIVNESASIIKPAYALVRNRHYLDVATRWLITEHERSDGRTQHEYVMYALEKARTASLLNERLDSPAGEK